MVAYNFQKQFAPPIREGKKTHTIRRNGNRAHAIPGQKLQIYTGMRTKSCVKIIEDDPTCTHSLPIGIEVHNDRISWIGVDVGGVLKTIENLELFAVCDGFANLASFHTFWLNFWGLGLFEGTLISWGDLDLQRFDIGRPDRER